MPSIRPNLEGGAEKRTTFRPPWVKDGPCPLPAPPTNPWLQQAKQSNSVNNSPAPTPVKKPKEKVLSIQREDSAQKSAGDIVDSKKIQGKPPVEKDVKPMVGKSDVTAKEKNVEQEAVKPGLVKGASKDGKKKLEKQVKIKLDEEMEKCEAKAPPPPPPMAPPPPPPPMVPKDAESKKPISKEKAVKLESLRSRPRRRPDWTDMMKEVETGIKLKRVKCNDRSAPILPKAKAKGQFVYESETHNAHNLLLKEIQSGVRLKKVRTNDRSKPILEGLRKFRRQMTIEELITKSASVADVVAVAAEPDELDDIDKVRDDLQSTKQMLALEMRNKEGLERENKRLLARLANLEAELEKEKVERRLTQEGTAVQTRSKEDDKLITRLKEEAAESAKMTKEMEGKYQKTAEELDLTRAKLESAWLKNTQLEMELKSKGNMAAALARQPSSKKIPHSTSQRKFSTVNNEPVESDSYTESETEDEDSDEKGEAKVVNQEEREFKLLTQKLRSIKEKRAAATKEKRTLKSQLSRLHQMLREEKKKYKLLQKEVEKMASLMKDVEEEGQEEQAEEEEDEEEEETETESEEEETEQEEGSDEDLSESATLQDKISNLSKRIKGHDSLFTRSKKGNYLLKVNIDRRQDDLNRQKEMTLTLQEDLNAVLSELG